ncbi:pimeloyl-ACP methyl ester carboxylesterase [Amycolatopsis lexingtonensis]|uniref:Pimeloyl-ACP methyl ester carboxylesterase n=1 Tax=Amycolatopsis lexingtonensis TaxID=218822 RepID=A0ABR9HSN2_9PSEU|nr:alpha/beta fold hydrolase [Amycolatopsis lexingtonensis]MBE1493941.1 pimeloyl-ACP methyl ester carboxylesterase [Amycolatopsis lexingtonensis]
MKPTIVLVPGMWHGGWAWDRVAALLEADGHPCVRVTFPGRDRAPGDETFTGHCAHLTRVLAEVPGDVVLVGHSYGGAVLTEAGDAAGVRAMVFVSAFCLEPGESVASVNDAEAGSEAGVDDIREVDDHLVIDPETARAAFYHDCDPADAARAAGRLTPEHVSTRTAVVSRAAWRAVPSHFVVCTADRACTPAVQRKLANRTGSWSELAASHSPMLSMPAALAGAITGFAKEVTA